MFKKLLTDTVWYGLSSILGRLVNYGLVPVYTALLPVAANGVITSLFAYSAFFNVVLTFGMETAYFRFARGSGADEREQAARGQTLIALVCAVFCMGGWLAFPFIKQALPFTELPLLVACLAIILVTDALAAIPLARLRLQGKAAKFAFYRLGTIGLNVALNLVFLLWVAKYVAHTPLAQALGTDKQPVLWVLYAQLLANLPLLLLVSWQQFIPKLLTGAQATFMIRYSWPIVLMGLAGMANQLLGILQLKQLVPAGYYPGLSNLEVVGVYGQCYKLSVFMALVVQAFRLGAEPFFFSLAGTGHKEAGLALVMRGFVWACIGILVGVTLNLCWIAPLVLRKQVYLQALGVVPILLVANLWLGVYYNLSVWFKLTDRTGWGTWLSLGGLGITVLFNGLLIPRFGYMGAAWATLACYFTMAITSYIIGQRYMPVPYPALRLFLYVALFFATCYFFQQNEATLAPPFLWLGRLAMGTLYVILAAIDLRPAWAARPKTAT